MAVRVADADDAPSAARLHASAITEGFLSVLGPRFLARLYARIVAEPGSFLLVACPSGREAEVVGFVAGSAGVGRLYRSFLIHDGPVAAISVAGRLVRSLPRVLETLRYGGRTQAGSRRGAELLSIAVEPSWRGAGIGRSLVDAFLEEVAARRAGAAHVVVAADNAAAGHLYRRAGFVEAGRLELHRGTESLLLAREVTPHPAGEQREARGGGQPSHEGR